MDRLADSYRLVYYDQRGRGRSRGELRLDEIGIERYVEDLDGVRRHLRLDTVAILGHSWGGFVAMHYALAHPERVSDLILLNSVSASNDDFERMRTRRLQLSLARRDEIDALSSSPAFRSEERRV